MHRKRIEQLVGDENALERFRQRSAGARQPIAQVAERRRLRVARRRARFDEVQTKPAIELGVAISNRAQDIRGQAAVAGSGLDQIEV